MYTFDGSAWNLSADLNNKVSKKVTALEFNSDDGTKLLVGQASFASTDGQVAIYELSGGTWSLFGQVITGPTNGGEWFGDSGHINGDGTVIFVGAKFATPPRAALYDYNSATSQWEHRYDVSHSDQGFGHTVQLSSDAQILVVGCHKCASNTGNVFVYSAGAGAATEILSAPGKAQDDLFGAGLAISADGMVVAGSCNGGYVKVFRADDSNRNSYTESLEIAGIASVVALSEYGSRIAIGSWKFAANAGKTEIMALRGNNAVSLFKMEATDANMEEGRSVAISADGTRYVHPMPTRNTGSTGRVKVHAQV